MIPGYLVKINSKPYLLKRLFHSDLPLTYHIHYASGYKNVILRMGMLNGKWTFLNSMNIDFQYEDLQLHLALEISANEKRITAGKEKALSNSEINQ